jgi:hypothetical protein
MSKYFGFGDLRDFEAVFFLGAVDLGKVVGVLETVGTVVLVEKLRSCNSAMGEDAEPGFGSCPAAPAKKYGT